MMRRGMGLSDIMMYLFLFFLVIIALAATGLSSIGGSVTITIESEGARQLIENDVAARSVKELFMILPFGNRSEDNAFDASFLGLRESERFVAFATNPRSNTPFVGIENEDVLGMIGWRLAHPSAPITTVVTLVPDDAPTGTPAASLPPPTTMVPGVGIQFGELGRSPTFVVGIERGTDSRTARSSFWTHGFDGSEPRVRLLVFNHDVPAGVVWVES